MITHNLLNRYTNRVLRKTVYCVQQLQHTVCYTQQCYHERSFSLADMLDTTYINKLGFPTKNLAY